MIIPAPITIYSNCDMTASSPSSIATPSSFNYSSSGGWKMVLDIFPYTGDMSKTETQYYVYGETSNNYGTRWYPFYVYYTKSTNKISLRWFTETCNVTAVLNKWNRITMGNFYITNELTGQTSSTGARIAVGGLSVAKIFPTNFTNQLAFIKEAWMYNTSNNSIKYHYYWTDDGTTMTFGGNYTVISTTNQNIKYNTYTHVSKAYYQNHALSKIAYRGDICTF